MVQKWKKYVDKIIKSSSRIDLADKVEDIINSRNLDLYDIVVLEWTKNQFRVRIWDYRIIFEKNVSKNRIIKINKRGDVYK